MKSTLEGSCRVDRARQLHLELRTLLERSDKVAVDISQVTACDLSLIQVLCAGKKAAARQGQSLIIQGPVSQAFEIMVRRSGLADACRLCTVEHCINKEVFHGQDHSDRG